jgi:hypothetical protein
VQVPEGLREISAALRRLAHDLKARPLAAAQTCELQLETCVNRLRDLLRDDVSISTETAGILRSIRNTLSELDSRIFLIRQINAGLVTLQTSHVNGYDAAGRPVGYRAAKR